MILITGASGFLGKHLLDFLLQKYGNDQIVALTSKPIDRCRYLLHGGYDFDQNFFVDSGYQGIHTIIHAGAYIPKDNSQLNNWKSNNGNILSTDKLLQSNLPELKKFIFISTVDVYGMDNVVSEHSPIDPGSLYGASKFYCERMIAEWAKGKNLILQILRLGHIYGPGEEGYKKIIPSTMLNLIKGNAITLFGSGDEVRSFMYVSDVVRLIGQAMALMETNTPINIAGVQKITIKGLIDVLILLSDIKDIQIKHSPSVSQGRSLIFNTEKMDSILGSEQVGLEEGLKMEWNYMKELYS